MAILLGGLWLVPQIVGKWSDGYFDALLKQGEALEYLWYQGQQN